MWGNLRTDTDLGPRSQTAAGHPPSLQIGRARDRFRRKRGATVNAIVAIAAPRPLQIDASAEKYGPVDALLGSFRQTSASRRTDQTPTSATDLLSRLSAV